MKPEHAALIAKAIADPFAGAEHYLRAIDPLWKVEIGELRAWDVRLEHNSCGCDCPHCEPDRKHITIEATTAAEALEAAEAEVGPPWTAVGVRPEGAKIRYIDAYDLERLA